MSKALLRQYVPKGTDLRHGQEDIQIKHLKIKMLCILNLRKYTKYSVV